jgi:phosphomannomutase/phosphoglucomutase
LEVVDELDFDLDAWIASYPSSFVTPEIRVPCEESEKVALVERVKNEFEKIPHAKLSLIDGVRVSFSDASWALVRASNTQAVLVIRIEAISKARLDEIAEVLRTALGKPFDV